ncbi:hypothetical protein ACWFNE_10115 [Cellulomonas sp. NPDC055163]
MRTSSTSSNLVVSTISGSGFTAALYVRDRFGLPFAPDVPPLAPAPPREASPLAGRVTAAAWDAWWWALAGADAGALVAPDDETLATLLAQVEPEAPTWGDADVDEAQTTYRPQWLPALLGTNSGSGRHDTEVVPVAGAWVLPLSDRRLLVSVKAYSDPDLMDALWRARIAALLGN